MPPTEETEESVTRRVGADGEVVENPRQATDETVVAEVPGDDPSKFVTLTMAHPLDREADRRYLGLPLDATIEVGTKVSVNKNGARALINAGLVMVDPEDNEAVRRTLRGESPQSGEPTSEGETPVEAPASPAANPPKAPSTPVTDSQPVGESQAPEAVAADVETQESADASTSGAEATSSSSSSTSGGNKRSR